MASWASISYILKIIGRAIDKITDVTFEVCIKQITHIFYIWHCSGVELFSSVNEI